MRGFDEACERLDTDDGSTAITTTTITPVQFRRNMVTMNTIASPQILTPSKYAPDFSPRSFSLYLASIFQKMLSTSCNTILLLLQQTFYATRVLVVQTCYTVALVVTELWLRGSRMVKMGWRASEPLRQKLFFEFMVFVLGGGYGILLILLWPGWIVVGTFALGLWFIRG